MAKQENLHLRVSFEFPDDMEVVRKGILVSKLIQNIKKLTVGGAGEGSIRVTNVTRKK